MEQGDFFGLDDLFTEREDVVTRTGGRVRGLDRAAQARRDPDRHRASRERRVLPAVAAADPRRCAPRGRPRLPRLRRGLRRGHARAHPVRPRPRAADAPRLPAAGPARRVRLRRARRPRHRVGARRRRLLPARRRRHADAADLPREPRHGARGAAPPPALGERCDAAPARSPRALAALPAARRPRRLLRRRGRHDRRGRRQARAAGHVPDRRRGVAVRAAGRLTADRHGLVADRARPSTDGPPEAARCAPGGAPGAFDRRDRRARRGRAASSSSAASTHSPGTSTWLRSTPAPRGRR